MHIGFNVALSMFEVHLPYDDINVNSGKILDRWVHFIGNENVQYDRTFTYVNKEKNQFVSYLISGNKVKGFLVYGFKNLHVYFKECLKMNIVPTVDHVMQYPNLTHLQIVQEVMKKTDKVECYKHKALSECANINSINYDPIDQKITHDIMKRSLHAYNAYKDHLNKINKQEKEKKEKEKKAKSNLDTST